MLSKIQELLLVCIVNVYFVNFITTTALAETMINLETMEKGVKHVVSLYLIYFYTK